MHFNKNKNNNSNNNKNEELARSKGIKNQYPKFLISHSTHFYK